MSDINSNITSNVNLHYTGFSGVAMVNTNRGGGGGGGKSGVVRDVWLLRYDVGKGLLVQPYMVKNRHVCV